MFDSTQATTLQCADCRNRGTAYQICAYPGAVSAPSDEGHVRRTTLLLCKTCATARLACQEPVMGIL
jgi:hypothetical protein